MAHMYYEALKPFMRSEILKSAEKNNYNNSEIAQILGMGNRAGSSILSGENMCSGSALLAYLVRLCTDVDKFLKSASEIIDRVDKEKDIIK